MKKRKTKTIFFIAIAVAAALAIGGLTVLGVYLFSPKSDPQFVAHQGFRSKYLGNTEAAFQAAAAESGFYGVETDIRKTKDGVFVCNHDATAKFANGEEKEIAATDLADLISEPLKNDKDDRTHYICTFERYLEICKSGNKVAVVELKEDFSSADLQAILAIVDAAYDRASISVISFYYDPLLRIREEDPSVHLQYLSEKKNDPVFERCLQAGIPIDVKASILTKKLVKTFHEAGLTVNVWTINETFDLNIVRIKGVDFVTTDIFRKEEGKNK